MKTTRTAVAICIAAVVLAGLSWLLWPRGQPTETRRPQKRLATEQQRAQISALIEDLVFENKPANNQPVYSPGVEDESVEYQQRFKKCQDAFAELSALKEVAFPQLVEHLSDERQSINFRNHDLRNSVGAACYFIIYYQLQDRPDDYSSYGFQRQGRDGMLHPKPYWEGTPFDDAGGVQQWLELNKELSYPEMQIKCLRWLLEREKAIGISDAESYFVNVLPLEVRILERRLENGEKVGSELRGQRKILRDKDASGIPAGMLTSR